MTKKANMIEIVSRAKGRGDRSDDLLP